MDQHYSDPRAEARNIMFNRYHPFHERYQRGDPDIRKLVEDLYREAAGEGQIDISKGVTIDKDGIHLGPTLTEDKK
ncbi:MAG TPA: hypothetical protein VFH55_04730 [Nitrospiria bacterium]|nr:hypothetical protein [Nitrospiria bacterium]